MKRAIPTSDTSAEATAIGRHQSAGRGDAPEAERGEHEADHRDDPEAAGQERYEIRVVSVTSQRPKLTFLGRRCLPCRADIVASARSTPVGRTITAFSGSANANPCAYAAAVSRTPSIAGPATLIRW